MSRLYAINAEVAGGLGPATVIANMEDLRSGQASKPIVTRLEYVFDDWLGDDLVESTPCYLVTKWLASRMKALSGFRVDTPITSTSELYTDIRDDAPLPEFLWLRPEGEVRISAEVVLGWSGHDLCQSQDGLLIVTEAALRVLRGGRLEHAIITPLDSAGNGAISEEAAPENASSGPE